MKFKLNAILPLLMFGIGISLIGQGYGQEIKTRREAYGAERAGQVELLLQSLFPKAKVEWEPVLAIREGSAPARRVDLGNFTTVRESDGSIHGVAALEVDTAKVDHIEKLKKFQSSDGRAFATTMVAFRTGPSGQRLETKKVNFDPYDPLTRITWFEVKSWSAEGGWPILRLRYESYTPSRDALTVLEWDALLDLGTGKFLRRMPTGIAVFRKDGNSSQGIFSLHRTSPTEVEILDNTAGKIIHYPCGEPCVVDGRTLMGQLSQQP